MRLRLFEAAQQAMQLPLPRGWPDVSANFIVEDDQARRVALILNREIEQRRRSEARVVHLAHGMRGKLHRVARVEQHGEDTVGFAAIAFEVGALGAGKDVPVHVPQVVARRIRAVFGEFLAEAEIRRAMQTVDESIDDSLRHQIQAGNSGEHRGIEEALQHLRAISSSTATLGCALLSTPAKPAQPRVAVLLRPWTAAACIRAIAAKFHPNRCGPIRRGSSVRCGGAAPGLPARECLRTRRCSGDALAPVPSRPER